MLSTTSFFKFLEKNLRTRVSNLLARVSDSCLFFCRLSRSIFIAFFFFQNLAAAQTFEASADTKTAVVGSTIEVSFTLKNGNENGFWPPNFEGFRVVSGPNTTNQMSIVNGKVDRAQVWSFMLLAMKTGQFQIGPAIVKIGAKTLKTNPLGIEVVAARGGSGAKNLNQKPGSGSSDEVFIRAEPSTTEAFIGQQIVLNYKLYSRVDLSGIEVNSEPKYDGFFTQKLERFDKTDRREVIGGKPFLTRNLMSIALFPQQTGDLEIEPMVLQVGIAVRGGGGFFGGFFNQVRPVSMATEAVKIRVKPLPSPAPENFCGAVGSYKINASLSQTTATTDDALTLQLILTGDGDPKRLDAPRLVLPPELETFEPKLKDESSYETGEAMISVKTFEYTILPKAVGEFEIRPETSVFRPEKGQFSTLSNETNFKLKITAGKKPIGSVAQNASPNSFLPNETEPNLKPINSHFFGTPLFWTFFLLPFLMLGGFFFFKKQKERTASQPISAEKQARQNLDFAEKHLAEAHQKMAECDATAFYDAVSHALDGYFSGKFRQPVGQLSKNWVHEKLAASSISPTILVQLESVWQACEMARFARQTDSTAMKTVFESAQQVLRAIENSQV